MSTTPLQKFVNVAVEQNLHRGLLIYAAASGQSISGIIRKLLERELEDKLGKVAEDPVARHAIVVAGIKKALASPRPFSPIGSK